MDNGYVIDTPTYNLSTGLYDVTLLYSSTQSKKTISCYRILNMTKLKYTENTGYFYISPDSNYLYLPEDTEINDYFKNVLFSDMFLLKSNNEILDINNDPMQKYSLISSLEIPNTMCLNLALENDEENRMNQVLHKNKYNQYDCLVKTMVNNSFKNVEKKDFITEMVEKYMSFSPSEYKEDNKTDDKTDIITNQIVVNDINEINNIHEYHKFYVYGLTILNLLLIILIIIAVLVLTQNKKPKNRY